MYDRSDASVMTAHDLCSGGNDQVHLSGTRGHEFRVSRTDIRSSCRCKSPKLLKEIQPGKLDPTSAPRDNCAQPLRTLRKAIRCPPAIRVRRTHPGDS